jgi:hypothetical protein
MADITARIPSSYHHDDTQDREQQDGCRRPFRHAAVLIRLPQSSVPVNNIRPNASKARIFVPAKAVEMGSVHPFRAATPPESGMAKRAIAVK